MSNPRKNIMRKRWTLNPGICIAGAFFDGNSNISIPGVDISGNLQGTLLESQQPNIKTVGTLTGLKIKSDCPVPAEVEIDGNLKVSGEVSCDTLNVDQINYVEKTITSTDNDLDVSGNVQVSKNLVVDGTLTTGTLALTTLNATNASIDVLAVTNNATVANLVATGVTTLATGSKIGTLTLADGSITDTTGSINFGGENLSTTGQLTGGVANVKTLSVDPNSTSGGALTIVNAGGQTGGDLVKITGTALQTALNVNTGNTVLGGTLGVAGVSTLDSATVTNNATVGGTLGVTGVTTLTNDLVLNGGDITNGTLTAANNIFATSTGKTTLGGGAVDVGAVGTATTVKGTLNVDEAVTLDDTLTVASNKTSQLGGDVTVKGGIDTIAAAALELGATTATSVNISKTGVMTTVKGTLNVDGAVALTELQVDNLNINGNTILASSGAVNITPAAGSAIVLDGAISIDAGVVTGATSITSTAFVGNADTATKITGITNDDIVQLTSTQTLTNKTITAPTITGNVIICTDPVNDHLKFFNGGTAHGRQPTTATVAPSLDVAAAVAADAAVPDASGAFVKLQQDVVALRVSVDALIDGLKAYNLMS